MTASRSTLRAALAALATATLVSFTVPALADTLQDIGKLLKQGQHAQALEKTDKYLAGKPKDAQGRFLRGLILTEMNRTAEAIAVFTKLTEDYPELPEPYNNLAVIYAQQKQYDKAKQALEMAIRTHPSYATAHENLGDIYARLASQAYDKALQIDSANASAQTKLAMIRDLMTTSSRPAVGLPATKPAVAAVALAPVAPEPKPAEAKSDPKPEPKPESKTAAKPVETKPVAVAATESKSPPATSDVVGEIDKTLEAWAAAWSKKNVKAYLSYYAKDFQTPGGESRTAWETERAKRVSKPGSIQVGIDSLRVTPEGADRATAKFRQHYRSASLKTSSNKVLVLVRHDGKWLIQQERVGR